MTLQEKVEHARAIIGLTNERFKKPIVMSSFGKDSMVLMHLVRDSGMNWPVLFHREPFYPKKYRFANQVIESWNLTVYDYRPQKVSMARCGDNMEIINEYQIGQQTCVVPTGMEPFDEQGEFLCGVDDLLCKPLGTFNYPWDVCLIGHKSTDKDPILGDIPFEIDFKLNPGSAHAAFPIRLWTDSDIWEYTVSNNIPIHHDRYENFAGSWREKRDKSMNPDYFPICNKCFDEKQPFSVLCPKHGKLVNNISGQVRVFNQKFEYINNQETLKK